MNKKKIFLFAVLIIIIIVGVFVKIKFPYITIEFLKNSLFPPASVVDTKTQATAVIYTKKLSIEKILELINLAEGDRMVVISTTNHDGSPHAGILETKEIDGKIEIMGFAKGVTLKNIRRDRRALITVYKKPEKNKKWFQNIGARLWVNLIKTINNGPSECKCLMEIVQFRAI